MDLSNLDLDYMIPKGTSHTSVPNSIYEIPKGTMKTRFEPSLPRMSAWKNTKIHTLRWYAQSESIIIKTHSKTIVLQDYRFYLLVFFLSLLLFIVPRRKTIVLRDSRIFLLVLLWCLKTKGGVWFLLLVLKGECQNKQTVLFLCCIFDI